MPEDLHSKIAAEIEKTGFPLELRTAAHLRARGYYVAHSVYFVDKDEQKGREIDLRGLMNRFFVQDGEEYAVRHVLAIECKKSNSRPWVFFCSEPVSYDQNVGDIHGLGFSGQWFRGGHKQWRIFQRRHPWFSRNIRGRAYFEPFSSGAEANATIVKALLASVKALLELKESGFAAGLGSNRSNIVFYYPLVVLQGDLFIARLINNELVVEEVDSVPVAINYQSPSYVGQDRFTVLVAKESALARETGALDKWLEYVSQHLRKHLAVFETPEATADAADA